MTTLAESARRPWVVALVGGPCSGKTKFKEEIAESDGIEAVCLDEAATEIFTRYRHMLPPDGFNPETLNHIQRLIAAQQLVDLDLGILLARRRDVGLVVCDRGVLDAKAYNGQCVSQLVNLEVGSLSGLYDQVIFFAPPPRAVWDQEAGNNSTRRETYDEMLELSDRLRACWEGHPGFVEVDGSTWERKRTAALNILLQRAV